MNQKNKISTIENGRVNPSESVKVFKPYRNRDSSIKVLSSSITSLNSLGKSYKSIDSKYDRNIKKLVIEIPNESEDIIERLFKPVYDKIEKLK